MILMMAESTILDKSCVEDASDMSDEDSPLVKANQAGKRKRHPENIFPLRTYKDCRAAAKTVK